MRADRKDAIEDLAKGLAGWRIWTRLGWQEVKRRYRRTILGPFWATFSLGVFVGAISLVWAPLFGVNLKSYLPFVATGMVAWTLVMALINEGCTVFAAGESLIKQLSFPYSTLAYMVAWRNIIVFLHHLLIVALIYLIYPPSSALNLLLLIPGLFIVAANGIWIAILIGVISARFRDIPPLVGSLMQIMLFITPIFWSPAQLGAGAQIFIDMNYLFHLVDIIRQPLLGNPPRPISYLVTIVGGLIGWIVMIEIYSRFRRRIAYWL